MIFKLDFSNRVKWCNFYFRGFWRLCFILNKIIDFFSRNSEVKIVYRGGEINVVVDILVK